MGYEHINYARDLEEGSQIARHIYLHLATQMNEDGECYESFRHIAQKVGCHRNSVIRAVRELEKLGVLVSYRQWKNTPSGISPDCNRYRMPMPRHFRGMGGHFPESRPEVG